VYADGEANDAVVRGEQTQRSIAEFAAGDDLGRHAGEMEECLLACV
jgi:hypothetical protein